MTHPIPTTQDEFINAVLDIADAEGSVLAPTLAGFAAGDALKTLAANWYDWMRDTDGSPDQLGKVIGDIAEVIAQLRRAEQAIRDLYGLPAPAPTE